jgi:hypothetical protein
MPEKIPTTLPFYYLVGELPDGTRYLNNLGKRCSWARALAAAEAAREAGSTWAVAFDRQGLFMVGVTPWKEEGFDETREVVLEAVEYLKLSLCLVPEVTP